MKVYQIFKSTGWGDDYHRYSVGTYLHKSKAEAEFKRLIEEVPNCIDCIYSKEYPTEKIEVNCPHFKLRVWEPDDFNDETAYDCENMLDDYDTPSFDIEEIEVDESEV